MSKKAVFVNDVVFDDGYTAPSGSEGTVQDTYVSVVLCDREVCLPEIVVAQDGTLKTPYITCDDTVLDAGTVLPVTDILVTVALPEGVACVSKSDLLITDE